VSDPVLRLIEQPVDVGEVLKGQTRLGRVHYHLSIYQHFSQSGESLPSHLEAEGKLKALDGFDLSALSDRRADLTLCLADGRKLEFRAADPNGTIRSTGRGLYSN
jgi:hypothetical protein